MRSLSLASKQRLDAQSLLGAALVLAFIAAVAIRLGTQTTHASIAENGLTLAAVFGASVLASITGFAFSPLAGALLAHIWT